MDDNTQRTTQSNAIIDLSGIQGNASSENPYDNLIEASDGLPTRIEALYEEHRLARNSIQRGIIVDPNFKGMDIDPILLRLVNQDLYPSFKDPRHCLVFWARPTTDIKQLTHQIQVKLRIILPNLWLMPIENLHMTVLEVAHSKTESEISSLVARLGHKIEEITDLTLKYRLRLIKPMLSYDASAIALSFVPDGGGDINESARFTDEYTYHHLRRDVFSLCKESGIDIRSRYSVPSAHITISRFLDQHDISTKVDGVFKIDCNKTRAWVDALEMLNKWLQDTYWSNDQSPLARGQWAVGEECGLDCRIGTLWYGGGSSLRVGKGSGSIQSSLP